MKNQQPLDTFYLEWEKYAHQMISPGTLMKSDFELFNNEQFKKLMASSPVVTFIINHATSCYEYCSENIINITGYTSEDFIKGGVPFGMSITAEEHLSGVAQVLIPKTFEFMEQYRNSGELEKIRLAYNYKVKRKDGFIIWTLHIMTVIEVDDQGNPLLSLVHLMDITPFKKDEKMDYCMSFRNENGYYETLHLLEYSGNQNNEILLSKREIEILQLLSNGFSSKLIADKLNLSQHTVNNHRKNMLSKTGCKNSSQLINYGICKGFSLLRN